MPLYEYLCESCGERTEILVDFSRDPVNTSVPLISLPFTAGGGGMGMGM